MRASLAPLVTFVIAAGCGKPAAQLGHDASTDEDARGFADAGAPDANASFSVQYTDPDHGPYTGGTITTIRGTGFDASDTVTVGGRTATDFKLVDPRHLQITTPPGDPGTQAIVVTRGDGMTAARADAFTYTQIAVSPPSGSVAGGTFVTITGLGTDFDPTTVVTFDGVSATNVAVSGATELTCTTPPGAPGDATVVVVTASSTYRADGGYSYYATGDPYAGGLSGGPIHGTLNVVVIDAYTENGVPNAFVAIGDPATTPWKGYTDFLGQITFSDPSLHGPVSVVAAPDGYEVGTFDCFDATNLTMFVAPDVPPMGHGPPGVGVNQGKIDGAIVFGDETGLGSPLWNLVPEPTSPTQVKRAYVTTAAYSLFGGPPLATKPIDYHYDKNTLSWPFEITASPGTLAVVAIAGIYDSSLDPSGTNPGAAFKPYALGVARNVLVGPDETVTGVDVAIDIPLDAAMRVDLVDPPPLGTDPSGPLANVIQATVDLGGEGAIEIGAHGLGPPPGGDWPGTFTLPAGATGLTIQGAPPLERQLADAGYSFIAGAFTNGGSPESARIVRRVKDISHPVEVAGFVGIPRFADPPLNGTASGRRAVFAPEHETAAPTFHLHYLSDSQGTPIWRGVACGAETDVELPDLSVIGRVWPPIDTPLYWSVWSVLANTNDFNQYTYRWNGTNYWTAYANQAGMVKWPSQ
jgi:hypothetical protein